MKTAETQAPETLIIEVKHDGESELIKHPDGTETFEIEVELVSKDSAEGASEECASLEAVDEGDGVYELVLSGAH